MHLHVIGLELKIPSTSNSSVLRDLSCRLSPWVLSNELSIFRAEWIWRSQTSPMLLAMRGFRLQVIHSPPSSIRKLLILVWFISLNAFYSSMFASTKLVPLSVQIILTLTLQLMNILNASMKLSVLMLFVVSTCTALVDIYVTLHHSIFFVYDHL